MKLIDWRRAQGLSQDKVARDVRASAMSISRIEKGRQRPSPELAKRIETYTKRAVTAASLLGLSDRRDRARGVDEEPAIYRDTETVSVDVTLVAQQRQDLVDLGIDIESVARKGAQKALAQAHSEAWREANKDAIAAYNAWIKKYGTFAEQLGLI